MPTRRYSQSSIDSDQPSIHMTRSNQLIISNSSVLLKTNPISDQLQTVCNYDITNSQVDRLSKSRKRQDFHHQPLNLHENSIRVVRVLPGSSHSKIKCVLAHQSLDDVPYSCLSYAWGDPHTTRRIHMNGQRFRVRKNLWDFLFEARRRGITQSLWIDAICIDQKNVAERNHQVQHMSQIYKTAKQVLIFPGHFDEAGTNLLRFADTARFLDMNELHRFMPGFQSLMDRISALPYWRRTWIVQEIYLARDPVLFIGPASIPFWNFAVIYRKTTRIDKRDLQLSRLCDRAHAGRRNLSFDSCMQLTELTQSADGRDRVYSMIGMCYDLKDLRVRYDGDGACHLLDVCAAIRPRSLVDLTKNISFRLKHVTLAWVRILCPCQTWDILSRAALPQTALTRFRRTSSAPSGSMLVYILAQAQPCESAGALWEVGKSHPHCQCCPKGRGSCCSFRVWYPKEILWKDSVRLDPRQMILRVNL